MTSFLSEHNSQLQNSDNENQKGKISFHHLIEDGLNKIHFLLSLSAKFIVQFDEIALYIMVISVIFNNVFCAV